MFDCEYARLRLLECKLITTEKGLTITPRVLDGPGPDHRSVDDCPYTFPTPDGEPPYVAPDAATNFALSRSRWLASAKIARSRPW
jgi:hypothetical protein